MWIAQTPFQSPALWKNERVVDMCINKFVKDMEPLCWFGLICCCCGLYCFDSQSKLTNLERWVAMVYRFIVSLIFSVIMLVKTSENQQLHTWCIILLVLTVVMSFVLSALNSVVVQDNFISNQKNLTLDRSGANLVSSGTLNEMEDLKLFGMNIDRILRDNDITKDAIFIAITTGDVDGLKTLVNNGVNFDVINDKQDTPLIAAVQHEQQEAVECMLSQGTHPANFICDINQRNAKTGVTALMTSARCNTNSNNIIKMLVEKFNADVNLVDKHGDSALHLCCKIWQCQCSQCFVESWC